MRKCILCGKQGEFKIYCKKCYLKDNPIIEKFKDINLLTCPDCSKFKVNGKWGRWKIEDVVRDQLKQKIILHDNYELKKTNFNLNLPDKHGPGLKVEGELGVLITAHIDDYGELSEEYILPITLNHNYCHKCRKSNTSYFEAIVQLRNIKFEDVEKYFGQITKLEKVRNGFDVYMASSQKAKNIAKHFQNLGAQTKLSATLHTKDKITSKDLYRLTILVKFPDYKKGDILNIDNMPWKIVKYNPLTARNLFTGKSSPIKITHPDILQVHKTKISKTHPQLEALHPENYQSVIIENPIELPADQKVKVVVIGDKLFLVV